MKTMTELKREGAEKILRNYLHNNYPKTRALIWPDNRHKLTAKKLDIVTALAYGNDDNKLKNLLKSFN